MNPRTRLAAVQAVMRGYDVRIVHLTGDTPLVPFVSAHVEATQGRRRSNAAGPHADRRTRRERDRGASKRAAIRDGRA